MSPKSKGRPRGRGRARPRGQRQPARPQRSVVDRVLAAAGVIGANVDAFEVELLASEFVALEITENGNAQRAEQTLVTGLGARLTGGRSSAAYTALSALRLVAVERERAAIDGLLSGVPGEHPDLPWARAERPEPRRAWLVSDPWGNQQVYVVGYDEPSPHQIAVVTTSTGGRAVWGISAGDPEGPEPWADVLDRPAEVIEPSDALSAVWDAILAMDCYWPPMWEAEDLTFRALARGRSEAYKAQLEEWHGIDDDERALLIDEFQARSDLGAPEDVVAMLADTFVDFGDGYLIGGVLAWKPREPERFLTDWVHRKVLLPDDAMGILPDVLKGWIEFCLGRKGLDPADIATVADEVDEARAEYERLRSDESPSSPHQAILRYLADNDVDVDDKDAVGNAVSAVNAMRLADLAAEAQHEAHDHD